MKKGLIFSLIISFISFLGLSIFAFLPKTNFSIDKIAEFNKFESSLILELQKDDYSYTEINKNITLSELKQKVEPNSKNNQATIFNLEDKKILTTNELKDYCEQNDLLLEETEIGYQVINKYALKRLIIFGNLPTKHNASKVLTYDDMHILCYNSIEATKSAYLNLKSKNIEATPDFILTATSDNSVSTQSTFNNWSEVAVDLDAYTDYRTDKEVVVAVLDTGINTLHPVFTNRLLKENGKIVGTSYESSSYTYNENNIQLTDGLSFEDDNGHGSHVAGIIASQTPSNVKILPIRVLDKEGEGSFTKIITALKKVDEVYAQEYNIVCANLSLGGYPDSSYFNTGLNDFNNIFNKLKEKNILSVVAAGNESTNTYTCLPAACEDSAIVVSALTSNSPNYTSTNNLIFANTYSNFGSSIDISAPGSSITSAWKASSNSVSAVNKTETKQGTSQATPHVSACIAKLCLDNDFYVSNNSIYTATQIEEIILSSALDLGDSGKDIYFGHGALRYTDINTKTEPNQTIYHTASNATFTYDGNYHNISINVTQPTSGYTIKYSLEDDGVYDITNINSLPAFKNANATAITVYYQISASNYTSITGSKTLKINPKNVEISITNTTSVYGESFNTSNIKYSCSGIVNNDNLGVTLNISQINFTQSGRYDVTYDNHTNTNYNITNKNVKGSHTIQKRTASINIENQSSVYGEIINLDQTKYSISGLVDGDTIQNIVLSTTAVNNSINNYDITATYSLNSNYSVSVNKGTYSVTKRSITLETINQTFTYGDNIILDQTKYTIISGSFAFTDQNSVVLTTNATSNSNTGSYDINLSFNNISNYDVTITKGKAIINPRVLTIEITSSQMANQKIEYGSELNLDENSYTIKAGNVLNKDKSTFKINLTSQPNPYDSESYLVYATCQNSNYSIVLESNEITIVPRKLSITINDQTFNYGDEIILDHLNYTITSGSFALNDSIDDEASVKLSTDATSTSSVNGDYEIDLTFNNMDKYDLTIVKGKVIINPRPITISSQQCKIYGEENNLNNTIYTIEEGNIVEGTNLELNFTSTATKLSPVDDYEISLLSNNSNYSVTLINSYLTINPKLIEIYVVDQSSTYGNVVKLDQTQYSVDLFELVENSNLDIVLSTDADHTKPVGNYTITATTTNPNYILDVEEGTFTINKRKISIRLYDQSVPHTFSLNYNKEDYDIMSGSIVGNDELNIKLSTNATAMSFAGDYKIMATYLNENYDITFTDATLTLEFSYVDALMILVPTAILILVATLVLVIVIKRKNKSIPLYKKWTK